MTVGSRYELLVRTELRYRKAGRPEKTRILDEFVAATSYNRKRAITLLNHLPPSAAGSLKRASKPRCYDSTVRESLVVVWKATNYLCSKRLVPFLPDFITAMQRFGHLPLTEEVKERLLMVSPSTVDRLLSSVRHPTGRGITTTRPGQLLKQQVPIRTFADWNDVVPGFLEGDLVAHCGDNASGTFLHTLTLTDISTGWTELVALLNRGEADVTGGLGEVRKVLPFPVLGLDTDNGSEFINYEMLRYCERENITFTRSRPYKKNDQAHVEEKNGSIVRRLVGYDRYQGVTAWQALSALYRVLRLYVNFFQPSLKLASKLRDGARTIKRYEKAQTPYQRLMALTTLDAKQKEQMVRYYEGLDPVALLEELQCLQDQFWQHSWKGEAELPAIPPGETAHVADIIVKVQDKAEGKIDRPRESNTTSPPQDPVVRQYRRTKKEYAAHTWRTREDPFDRVWGQVTLQLQIDPSQTAKQLFARLQEQYPSEFSPGQLRTLQRRVRQWRHENLYNMAPLGDDPFAGVPAAMRSTDTDASYDASGMLANAIGG